MIWFLNFGTFNVSKLPDNKKDIRKGIKSWYKEMRIILALEIFIGAMQLKISATKYHRQGQQKINKENNKTHIQSV